MVVAAGQSSSGSTPQTTTYSAATATVQLTVKQASPVITWGPARGHHARDTLSSAQLDATASVPGTFSYSPAAGAVPPVGTQPLTAPYTPTDATDYMPATAHNSLTVDAPSGNTPAITWRTPAAISYGTALSSAQLNATANVPGTFTYTPAAGAVLKAGTQTLAVVFTPTDSNTYSSATATVQLTVNQATPTITWAAPAAIAQGTALSPAQLNATANVPGTFVYNPAAGNVPAAGTLQLAATFTRINLPIIVFLELHRDCTTSKAALRLGRRQLTRSHFSSPWLGPKFHDSSGVDR